MDIKKVWFRDYKTPEDGEKAIARLTKDGWQEYARAEAVVHLKRDEGYEPPKPKKVKPAKEEPKADGAD